MFSIVITAYNRANALGNLLKTLSRIKVPQGENIPLTISIDNNGTPEVVDIANQFEWEFGEKTIIIHKEKLGLVKHFIWAGDNTYKYENVLFLEDDLLVSPNIIYFTNQFIDTFKEDPRVVAASLYNPILNEATGTKFYQIEDGKDCYFLQHPYWGNIWLGTKWNLFKEYLQNYEPKPELLPRHIAKWTASFKKIYIQFLIERNFTVLTPRISLVTNGGSAGLHSNEGLSMYQVPLQLAKDTFEFPSFNSSLSKYDAFEEIYPDVIKRLNPDLTNFDFTVDLNGTKSNSQIKTDYILTSKSSLNSVFTFTSLMKPTEQGVIMNIEGDKRIVLCKTDSLIETRKFYKNRKYQDIIKNYSITPSLNFLRITLSMFFNYCVSKLRKK